MLFSLFLFSCVGIWNQEQTFHICPADRRWCVNRRSEGSHPCQAFQSLSCPTYRCLLKRCFGLTVAYWIMWLRHLNSLLDLFCLGPWGWEGLVFWPLMCLKKAGYLYHCFFALILWLLLWGTFWCAELSFVRLLHGMSFWFIFVLGTNHPSCSLLCTLSWKQVIADQFIWNLCLLTAVQKIQYFNDRQSTFAWRDGWHCSNCPFSPQALSCGKKILSL